MLVITQVQPIAVDFTLPEDNLPEVVAEMKKPAAGRRRLQPRRQDQTRRTASS